MTTQALFAPLLMATVLGLGASVAAGSDSLQGKVSAVSRASGETYTAQKQELLKLLMASKKRVDEIRALSQKAGDPRVRLMSGIFIEALSTESAPSVHQEGMPPYKYERAKEKRIRVNGHALAETFSSNPFLLVEWFWKDVTTPSFGIKQEVRAYLAAALGEVGPADSRVLLETGLEEESYLLRMACAKALGKMACPESLPALFEFLKTASTSDISGAAVHFAVLSCASKESVPYLREVLQTAESEMVRKTAEEALRKVTP